MIDVLAALFVATWSELPTRQPWRTLVLGGYIVTIVACTALGVYMVAATFG